MNKGKVYIIGAGPGDYKLITLKAAECIEKSDVIVYDRLVGSKILKLARKDAELVYVGKLPDRHVVPQERINAILVESALQGKKVARVKGGDPFVFGRGGEECEALRQNGIEYEVVPGVTSAISVPAYAGIPVTHRDYCSSLHIITGHERPGKEESSIDYTTVARLEGTLVFLMGVRNLKDIARNLIKNGKKADTPAAVIERGTTSRQRVISGTLEDIAEKAEAEDISSPAVTVVGRVAGLGDRLGWFPRGKLAGRRVLVTRSREQASHLAERIGELGGEAVEFPVIRIEEPESYEEFDGVLAAIDSFEWLVFTSVNGVEHFFKRMRSKKLDIRRLAGIKLCAVGPATAQKLEDMGFTVDYVPKKYTTEELLKGLMSLIAPGGKVLLARADIADPELSEGLKAAGIECRDLKVYRTVPEETRSDEILSLVEEGGIDIITFTSSSTVHNFVKAVGKEKIESFKDCSIACIGPVTARTAREYGLAVEAEADVYTIDGLVEKIVELVSEVQ